MTSGSSVIFGSGGIGVLSGTGVGGAGVVLRGVVPVGGGGGIGRATGGFFPQHAHTPRTAMRVTTTSNCVCLISLCSPTSYVVLVYCDQFGYLLLPSRVIWRTSLPSRAMV